MINEAVVLAVHPSRRTVDLASLDNRWHCAEVPVASGALSSLGGSWSALNVPPPASNNAIGQIIQGQPALYAIYDFTKEGKAVVTGFLLPLGGVAVTSDDDRDFHLHRSGSYATISPDGSVQVTHASGAVFRIGTGGAEAVFAPGTADAPTITLQTAEWSMVADPSGNVTVTAPTFKVVSPTITLQGAVTVTQTLTADGDVKGNSISMTNHYHSNSGGTGNGGPPVAGS